MDSLVGQQLGKYTIERMLGRGGMAAVFLAHDPNMERQVAIKILPREFAFDPMYVERFRREVKTIAKLTHPNIVPVHDYGEDQGWTYIVMTYLPGGTLQGRVRALGNTMPLDLVASYFEQIGSALDYAHAQGVIHRDFKPGNVLIGDKKHVLLSDFGVAKVSEATSALTGTGTVGTPAYMAPELANRGGLSPLVDVYAAGVTLYEMVTGSAPFEADTPMGLIMAHVSNPVPDARYLRPELPEALQRVIAKGMAKEPDQRYQSAGEMAADLRAAVGMGAQTDSAAMPFEPEDDGPHTVRTPLPARQTPPGPTLPPLTVQATRKRGASVGLLAGAAVGLIVVAVAALGLMGVLPLGLGATQAAAVTASPAPIDSPIPTVEDASPLPSSTEPTIRTLFGDVTVRAAGESDFAALPAETTVTAGASIQTGATGAALITLAEGVRAELHPNSQLTIQRLEAVGDTLFVELAQEAGTVYHIIGAAADGLKREYVVTSPGGFTKAIGTQFWISQGAEGWYYIPTEGVITHDLRDLANDPSDQYDEHASRNDCLLVDASFNVSNCARPEGLVALTTADGSLAVTPTPTRAVVEGEQPTATVEEPTLTPTALAAVEQCGPGWLPTGGCKCCGTTLVCANGTVAEFNPQCGIGGSGPPTPAPGCGSCGDGGSEVIHGGYNTQNCQDLWELYLIKRDACGVECYNEFIGCEY